MTTPAAALDLRDIRKRFGTVVALDGAELTVRAGTIHGLIGENGAGKTTLMRVAYGLMAPDEGTVSVGGTRIRTGSTAAAIGAGLGMVQQHFALVPALTIRENIALGISAGRTLGEDVVALARSLGLEQLNRRLGGLSIAEQQRVEIVKALARGARILILDEPTAALAPQDADELFGWLRAFRAGGGSAVLITHKLREAMALADDLSVLRHGRVTWSGPRDQASIDILTQAMLGHPTEIAVEGPGGDKPGRAARRQVAEADGVSVADDQGTSRIRDASLRVFAGEVLGVAGVEGSGYRELMYALAGRRRAEGPLRLPDEIGFVPDDRQGDALLPDRSIMENVALRHAGRRRGWFRRSDARAAAERLVQEFEIRVADVLVPVSALSGGNQQRLLLARELDGHPEMVVAINPTRGLDVAAASNVQRRLLAARDGGAAIVYYSADLEELVAVADRIVVVFDGRVREAPRDRAAVGRAMVGAA